MANPYASYNMSPDKEKGGTYIEAGAFRIKVARAGGKNVKYTNTREGLTKPHRRAIQTDTLPPEIMDRLNAELAAKALVTSWEVDQNFGETDENGVSMEPNWIVGKMHDPETGEVVDSTVELMTKTFIRFNDLYLQVAGWASDAENYLDKEAIEADVKN